MTDKTKWNLISAGLGLVLGLAIAIPQYIHWQNTKPELIVVYHPEWYTWESPTEEELDVGELEQEEEPLVDTSRCAYQWIGMDEYEFYLLSHVVEAEAGNQDLYGKKLVVDVVFNRVLSDEFPNSIEEVITQEGQFTTYNNKSFDKISPSEETYEAIALEYDYMTNMEVMFFRTGKYHVYGEPLFKVGDHYFNTLKEARNGE